MFERVSIEELLYYMLSCTDFFSIMNTITNKTKLLLSVVVVS